MIEISYGLFFVIRAILAIGMVIFGLISIYLLSHHSYKFYPWWAIAFWTLIPPIWFFLEYYAMDVGVILPPEGMCKSALLANAEKYSGPASKIWAAVLAAILFLYKRNSKE